MDRADGVTCIVFYILGVVYLTENSFDFGLTYNVYATVFFDNYVCFFCCSISLILFLAHTPPPYYDSPQTSLLHVIKNS